MLKTQVRSLLAILLLAVVVPAFSQAPAPAPRAGSLVTTKIHSPALEGNKLGDPADQDIFIYLPPSYASTPDRRFPTLYLLHGYVGRPGMWTDGTFQGMKLPESMDRLIASGAAQEMIVVMPNGRNKYLGSMYTNSNVTGNWEDYIARDVVAYTDSHYRTLARPASRGIAGHSMGGYGAFTLAMKHPDVFGAVYALSPCCVGMKADLTSSNPFWHSALAAQQTGKLFDPKSPEEFFTDAFIALGSAWSPNPGRGPLFVDLPYREEAGSLAANEPVLRQWEDHSPLGAAPNYKNNLLRLRAISFDYGLQDNFAHIPLAIRLLSEELAQLGVPHVLASYQGDHGNRIRERFETVVVPFFSQVLEEK